MCACVAFCSMEWTFAMVRASTEGRCSTSVRFMGDAWPAYRRTGDEVVLVEIFT